MGRPCTYYVVSKLCIVLRNLSITAAPAVVIVLAPCSARLCGDRPITRTEDVQSDCAAHLKCLTTARDATFSRVRDAEASAAALSDPERQWSNLTVRRIGGCVTRS